MKERIRFFATCSLVAMYFANCNSGVNATKNPISTDPVVIKKGQDIFGERCSGCHNFKLDGIGPDLGGITSVHSAEWIKNFISNPKQVLESGDTTAQKLIKQYKLVMPSFENSPDSDINAVIAYINTQRLRERPPVAIDTNDIKNPIPDSITTSGLMVSLDSVTQIPASSDVAPLTRITKLDYQPNTGDIFILDLRGKLYKLQDGKPKVYMDMAALKSKFINQPGLATGFGSFAFHPEFAKNGLLYTTHTEPPGSGKADFSYADSIPVVLQWVLTEWKTDSGKFPFSGTGREILRIDMPSGIHGMQEITFDRLAKPGNDDYGLLYAGIGDGGSSEIGYPLTSENSNGLWGSIIRIDPSGHNSNNGQYGIPPGNPFAQKDPGKYAREIYAYGFRNPHRLSWSPSGQMLAVNIGQTNIESVNLVLPGHFYGWPLREGTFVERFFNETGKIYPLPPNDSIYHVTYPVAQFDHDEGTAICGGFAYSGNAIPALKGKFLFGDIASGTLFFVNLKDLKIGKQATIKKWNISYKGQPTTLVKLSRNHRVEMRFGMDSKGELYILTKADGKVYKMVSATMKS